MKKIAILFVLTTLFCCSTDETSTISENVNGNWRLTNYISLMDTQTILGSNDVIYHFDVDSKRVVIRNYVETIYPFIKKTGSYPLAGDNTTIIIGGRKYAYVIVDGELKLSENSGSGRLTNTHF
ncbi:hypothetical protein [Flavobacterium sp. 3HN19-14]|uniref:hypothetical protein n=1 Tax=Flavobacterium sp. 3HN19-14 TaxID=3448133 RepID=UPI003EDFE122